MSGELAGYFDCNATAPMHPAAVRAWTEAVSEHWHNPGSPTRAGARVRHLLSDLRAEVASWTGAGDPSSVIFTSGATESANAVLRHFAAAGGDDGRVLVSALEHPAVTASAQRWFGGRVDWVRSGPDGVAELGSLAEALDRRPLLACLMAANNETGVLQPWEEAAALCRERGVPLLCDLTQWAGRMPVEGLSGCGFLILSGHKLGGPKGVGVLRLPAPDHPLRSQEGGGQEFGHRSGTENVPAIASMVAAWREAQRLAAAPEERSLREGWRDSFVRQVRDSIPGSRVWGSGAPRLWNTVSLLLPEFPNTRWVARLEREGFLTSTGSSCASRDGRSSSVLASMGVPESEIRRTLRLSSGWGTAAGSWSSLAEAMSRVYRYLREEPGSPSSGSVISIG